MRSRVITAAVLMLAGTVWVSAVSAAPVLTTPITMKLAPKTGVLLDRTGHVVNLNLGGVSLPSLAQDSGSLHPNALNLARSTQLEFSHGRNWDNFGNLFPGNASLTSAYLSGTNAYAGAVIGLSSDVSFTFGHSVLGVSALSPDQPSQLSRDLAARLGADVRNIGTTSANLDWNFSNWGGVGLTASRSSGDGSLLGVANGSLGPASLAESSALGITARVGFGEGWVTTVAYSEGVTQLDLSRDLKLTNPDPLHSQAYGIGFAKQGLFGDDALGIAVSRPLQVYSGANLAALNSGFALSNMPARESDVALGYVTTFLDGTLALQANAAYQLNAAGTKGQTAVTGVARAKLNF